jgi:ElaB protein
MPEPTKSAQEASKITGGSQQAREHSSFSYEGSGRSGSSSTMRQANEIIDQTRQSLSDTYNRASHGLNETLEQAMDYSRENPGKSTLIAFGLGLGVGLLMANSFATRSRTRRIVPPVMNALSEIASELFR